MDINNFPVKKELKHEIACCITAYMAAIGIDVTDGQQQEFQDKHSEDLIDSVLDAICGWQESTDDWVKVEDMLPKNNQKILFYDNFPNPELHLGLFMVKDHFNRDNIFCDGAFFHKEKVSHWKCAPDQPSKQ